MEQLCEGITEYHDSSKYKKFNNYNDFSGSY
jgi:hypothetical protein